MTATVVGGGVVGLSCAVRLVEHGWDVEVVAAEPAARTTSSVAGALWMPYRAEPADRVAAWARTTLEELLRLHGLGTPGVRLLDGVVLDGGSTGPLGLPPWAEQAADLVPVRPLLDPAPGYRHGLGLRVPLVDMARYLPWLVDQATGLGVRVRRARLTALPAAGPGDVVVDAAGLGARELAADPAVHAVRGQVVVVSDPGLTRFPGTGPIRVVAAQTNASGGASSQLARYRRHRPVLISPRWRTTAVRRSAVPGAMACASHRGAADPVTGSSAPRPCGRSCAAG